jgi:hypothetical protein
MEMKWAAVSNIILLLLINDLGDILRHPQCRNTLSISHESKKEYLTSVPFYQQRWTKNICLKSNYNTLINGMGQADDGEKLEHLAQQIAHKASYTPRLGLFPTAELHWQFRTRVIQPREFSISFLTVGQTFWSLTHNPPGGLGLLSSEGPNEVRDVYCQHVINGMGQADDGEKLEHVTQQIAHKASYTPRSGLFPTAELHWQFRTRVIQPGEFSISFLAVGQTFWSLTHNPPGALVFSPVKDPMKWEMFIASMCLPQGNHKRGVFKIVQSNTIASENTLVLELVVSQHTAKVWSSMLYCSGRFRITSAWSEPLEDTAWKTPSRMSIASQKSGDVTLIAIISTSDSQYHPQSASLAFHQNERHTIFPFIVFMTSCLILSVVTKLFSLFESPSVNCGLEERCLL